jgi:3-oxoacyl-[acyl-carrier-protein] synthase II
MTRIVITGLGAITPIGNDVNTFWTQLTAGVSGAGPLTAADADDFPARIACEVKDFDPVAAVGRKLTRRTPRSTQLALVAARQALADANLVVDDHNAAQVGVVLNTGGGGIGEVESEARVLLERGPRAVSPFHVPRIMPNCPACIVSIETGAKGPVLASTLDGASGSYALLEAYHFLQRGEAQAMLAGGSESLMTPLLLDAFARAEPLSSRNDNPAGACRPFDATRDGTVCGEGAAVMVLETEEHARQRSARIYAEVLGGQLTGDAHHISEREPNGDGAARATRGALQSTGLTPTDVDVIFAHGTGDPLNDVIETKVIETVFGEHAHRLAITATKSMVGHTLGAAGAISALAAALTLDCGLIPPTINYTTPDPECDLDYVPNVARQHPCRVAMVNAFSFGGQNVALLLGRYQGADTPDPD